jgi:ATP-binding cassette subfamily B (MDR/TAP) protein 1
MKPRLFKVSTSKSSENAGDWIVPIERQLTLQDDFQSRTTRRDEPAATPTWRSLFTFTTRGNWMSIMTFGTGTIVAGVMKPASAIFFGDIFSVLSKFGAGTLDAKATLHQTSIWCIVLVALGIGAWIAEGIFFSAWIIFGELQAQVVRTKLFDALLEKEQEWYDLREDGIGSLLIRIQT